MGAVAWSNIRANPIRLLSTALSVVLGIAFVAGTFVFTDTIRAVFDDLFGQVSSEVDVAVRPVGSFGDQTDQFGGAGLAVDEAIIPVVEAVPGVAAVEPEYLGTAQLVDADGELIGGQGPPTVGSDRPTVDGLTSLQVRAGRYPEAAGEVAIDASTAEEAGLAVGATLDIAVDGPTSPYTVVGLVGYEQSDSLAGATLALFSDAQAREFYGADGATDLLVLADAGVDPEDLRTDVAAAVGDDYDAVTGEALAAETSADVGQFLDFFTIGLLVFAGIALLVGSVIIFNTFNITVTQRNRELALLRAIGADRRQVLTTVLLEALAVGIVGSVVGLGLGVVIAVGLRALMEVVGFELPLGNLILSARTAMVSIALGVVVTVLAAIAPALKATRVAPVEAMRAVSAPAATMGRWRWLAGGLVLISGIGVIAYGLFSGGGIYFVGGGALLTLLAVALLSPLVTAPMARVLGAPIAAGRGVPGELARENAMRNPRRTASTAAALMIGLGLVSFVLIFAASLRASLDGVLDEQLAADFLVQPSNFVSFPEGVTEALADIDGVELATATKVATVGVEGAARSAVVIDPVALPRAAGIEVLSGELAGLGAGGIALAEDLAIDLGVGPGDSVQVALVTPDDARPREVAATFAVDSLGAGGAGSVILDRATYAQAVPDAEDAGAYVLLDEGVEPTEARVGLEAALAPYPTATLFDQAGIRDQISQQTNQLLGLVFGLLFLSIIIALVGIVNTLGLSVLERTRELGLLRAVGMGRSQTRTMIRWESVIIAVFGALLGLVVGVLFGWLGVRALADTGFSQFAVPVGQLALAVVAAGLAGVLAAVLPARRASRVDILRALQVE